jgi:prolipoprotein diacylglyceryltransferase
MHIKSFFPFFISINAIIIAIGVLIALPLFKTRLRKVATVQNATPH